MLKKKEIHQKHVSHDGFMDTIEKYTAESG